MKLDKIGKNWKKFDKMDKIEIMDKIVIMDKIGKHGQNWNYVQNWTKWIELDIMDKLGQNR